MKRFTLWSWAAIGALAAVLAIVAYFALQEPKAQPRAREFRDYDVCLLTDENGIAAGPASSAWNALQEVSKRTDVRAFYLDIKGAQTPEAASQYVGTLVTQRCGILVAVGQNQVAGLELVRAKYPKVHFITQPAEIDRESLIAQVIALIPEAP